MPLVFQYVINASSSVGLWHILEEESFFTLEDVVTKTIAHPHKRLQHLAGRYLLTILHHGLPVHQIKISETNKPYLSGDACHFSISHCGNYAAAIVCESAPAGIDVEVITDKALKLAFKFMNESEHQYLNGDEVHDRKIATAIWSIKEAVFKWYGKGAVNFKTHISVDSYPDPDSDGLVHVSFTKDAPVNLRLEIRWQKDHVVVWLCQ